jgi:hypothetical protein
MIGANLVGGLLGTLVLTSMLRVACEIGLTRMDLALILGTIVTRDRRKARAVGYAIHVVLGLTFAALYGVVFLAVGWHTWWLGALLGAAHAMFVGAILLNILVPAVHPLMGTSETAANEYALIEPPGFMMINYGRHTASVMLASHVVFGAIVGWAARL